MTDVAPVRAALDVVREAVATVCRTPIGALVEGTRPADVIGWDSFGRLQVVLELERLIGRELPLERAMAANSVLELAVVIDEAAS